MSREYRLHDLNGISSLQSENATVPDIRNDRDILVRIKACALNYRDLMVVNGKFPSTKADVIPVSDAAGIVEKVGPGVKEFKEGDKVLPIFNQAHYGGAYTKEVFESGLGRNIDGVLATYRVFPETGLVHMPAHLTFEQGATLVCAGLTAFNALFGMKPLLPGQTVLLLGTGGVSIFGLQFAKMAGAKTIVTSSSDHKLEYVKSLGADHVINYNNCPNWSDRVRQLTNGRGVDHILEVGGAGTLKQSFACLKLEGVISAIGFLDDGGGPSNPNLIREAITKQAILRGFSVGSRLMFQQMNDAVSSHHLVPVVDKQFTFDEAAAAYKYLASQKHIGKVCITV